MAYTYSTFVPMLAAALVVEVDDADFLALLPAIIDEAEQRIYRELDLVASSVVTNASMVADSRYMSLPNTNGHIIVIDNINIIDSDRRYQVRPATLDAIDFLWPQTLHVGDIKPQLFYRLDDDKIVVGPVPNTTWPVEIVGTVRPNPLSISNGATFLSTYLSDLFFSACMVAGNAILLKNVGAASEDPQQAMSWESKYQTLKASAQAEELRKLFISGNSPLPASAKA